MDESAQREVLDQVPIQPIYQQAKPNDPIEFGSHAVSLSTTSKTESLTGNFSLGFIPDKSFSAKFESRLGDMKDAFTENESKISFTEYETTHKAFFSSGKFPGTVSYRFKRLPIKVRKPTNEIHYAVFHLFNWPNFSGQEDFVLRTAKAPLQGYQSCGRFTFEFDKWRVCVADTENTSNTVKSLKESGGYVITHVGSIQRIDDSIFDSKQLEEVLIFLRYFFSFALGVSTSPALTIGFDTSKKRVYEEW